MVFHALKIRCSAFLRLALTDCLDVEGDANYVGPISVYQGFLADISLDLFVAAYKVC
jgi:hypothetical protein